MLFQVVYGEVVDALDELVPARESGWSRILKAIIDIYLICHELPEWLKLNAKEAMMPVICRASNRTFVGAPLCQSLPLFDIQKASTFVVQVEIPIT